MDFCVNTIPENQRCEVSFLEYNIKTRMGIWLCLLMMLLVLALVLAGVFDSARREEDRLVNATNPDDAIYVNALPQGTSSTETTQAETTISPETTTGAPTADTERKALYYVTVSGERIVLLDEYGEFLRTLHENALFLPSEDLAALRTGVAVYSSEELADWIEDLS